MSYLLDTHVFLWWMADDPRLSAPARAVLEDRGNELLWSVASTWELAIKASIGKVTFPAPLDNYLPARLRQQGIDVLPIAQPHALRTSALPWHHKDPFDRMLVAQCQVEGIPLLSGDKSIADYSLDLVW